LTKTDDQTTAEHTKNTLQGSRLCAPLRVLEDEHRTIMKVLRHMYPLLSAFMENPLGYRPGVVSCLEFISHYADRFHHAKEEEIVFSYFDSRQSIIAPMNAEHVSGRKLVFSAARLLQTGRTAEAAHHLDQYRHLLVHHIQVEHAELFPWINENLTSDQVAEITTRFAQVDARFRSEKEMFEQWSDNLEDAGGGAISFPLPTSATTR
jgi:hemerythrin-like domain-containing protein